MQISAQEIAHIEEVGMLDESPVKMVRTKGGFWIAVGKPYGHPREGALAAGSHPAIVKFNLSKQFPMFQENLMKSEAFSEAEGVVEKHSHFLSDDLRKSGHDVYSIQKGSDIVFHVTKHDVKIGQVVARLESGDMVVSQLSGPSEFSRAMAGAASEKAQSCGAKKLKIEAK